MNEELQTIEFFDSNNNSLGFLNEFEFKTMRKLIITEKLKGFYTIFNDERILLDENAKFSKWFAGFYDLTKVRLENLITI